MAQAGEADNYAYEEEQERKALLQNLHGPMKQWYNGGEATRSVGDACVLSFVMCLPSISIVATHPVPHATPPQPTTLTTASRRGSARSRRSGRTC